MNFPTRLIILLTTDRFSDLGPRHQEVTRLINRSSGLSSTSRTHALSVIHQENDVLTGARATSGRLTFSLALDPSIWTLISDSSRVCTHPGLKEYCRRESESALSGSRSDSLNVASKTRERTSICRRWCRLGQPFPKRKMVFSKCFDFVFLVLWRKSRVYPKRSQKLVLLSPYFAYREQLLFSG